MLQIGSTILLMGVEPWGVVSKTNDFGVKHDCFNDRPFPLSRRGPKKRLFL